VVSAILIVLWLIDLRATYLQWSVWRLDSANAALRSRVLAGALLTLAATAVAVLAAMRLLRLRVPDGDMLDVIVVVFVIVSVPQAHWLWSWWRGWL